MGDIAELKSQIEAAFAGVAHPETGASSAAARERRLRFSKRTSAPDGFGTALSFFSDEAFHFNCRRICSPTSTGG